MAEQAPEIKVKLTAEDTGVAAAIRQLGQELKNLKNSEQQAAEGALSLKKAFEGLVAIGALLKLEEVGKEAFDSAVNIGKMADKTGLSTETLSVFHKVAEDVAVSTEAVDKGLIKAAKSITEFQQGSQKAAAAFGILGIKQKDFQGLNPDQKIALVADRLGHLQNGFQKASAAQAIFSKGGAEMIPVLNYLAAEGFDNATKATARLGLLLSKEETDSFRAGKQTIKELGDAGKGMATQFEAGLLPAISDVGEAILASITNSGKDKNAFKELGERAGRVVREIAFQFLWMGKTIGTVLSSVGDLAKAVWKEIGTAARTEFDALDQASRGHFVDAFHTLTSGIKNSTNIAKDEVDRQKAIYAGLATAIQHYSDELFPSDEEEARRIKERAKQYNPEDPKAAKPVQNDAAVLAELKRQNELDAIAKAQAAALFRQLQDELEIWRAYEKQREEIEKNSYDQGKLSTTEYYQKRQEDLKAETAKELELLKAELRAAQDEVARTASERDKFSSKSTAAGQDTKIGQEYGAAAARANQENIASLTKVDELQTKIATTTINGQTRSIVLETERLKASETDEEKVSRFEAEIAQLQGKRVAQTQKQIEAEAELRRGELERKGGLSTSEIDAEIAKWKQLKAAVGDFEAAEDKLHQTEKAFEVDRNAFEIQRSAIEAQQRAGLITKSEAEKRINDLITQRLPLLRQEAAAELAAAQAALRRAQVTGNQDEVVRAQQQVQAAQNLAIELDKIGTKTRQLQTQVTGAFQSSFTSFFDSLITHTRTVGQAFAQLGVQIVQDLEKIAAQMLINFAIQKLTDALGLGGGTQKTAQTIATNDMIITSNAGAAGAAAFASVMETVPFPANIALAPEVMAVAVGTTLSNLALGSAAKGAYLDKDMLVQAHADEMILPSDLSSGLQRVVDAHSFGTPRFTPSQLQIDRSTGNTYNSHDEYHLHHTGPDARSVLEKELVPMIQSARRRGRLNDD